MTNPSRDSDLELARSAIDIAWSDLLNAGVDGRCVLTAALQRSLMELIIDGGQNALIHLLDDLRKDMLAFNTGGSKILGTVRIVGTELDRIVREHAEFRSRL